MIFVFITLGIITYLFLAHHISYSVLKNRILKRQTWDLNICCGTTDGGGLNVDIVKHGEVPNFRLIDDVYELPFENNAFDTVLCSHTIEHVDQPHRFLRELQRVGKEVTVVIPPIYDLTAAFNFLEHKNIFLSFKKEHQKLPRYIRLPLANVFQRRFGQNLESSAVPMATLFSRLPFRRKNR